MGKRTRRQQSKTSKFPELLQTVWGLAKSLPGAVLLTIAMYVILQGLAALGPRDLAQGLIDHFRPVLFFVPRGPTDFEAQLPNHELTTLIQLAEVTAAKEQTRIVLQPTELRNCRVCQLSKIYGFSALDALENVAKLYPECLHMDATRKSLLLFTAGPSVKWTAINGVHTPVCDC